MSRLNDIHSSYGKTFGMAVANTSSYNVMTVIGLPKNTLIVASPDEETHSMIVTDNDGNPVRLTYDIMTGNGIVENNGTLSLEVDNSMFVEDSIGNLSLEKSSLIDNITIKKEKDKLVVDTQEIAKASATKLGVVKVDGTTITSDKGTIYVDTSDLDYSNNNTGTFGTIKGSDTIKANNGILSVNANNLKKASNSSYGILKADNSTIVSNDGILSVNINSFRRASSTYYGISKPDNNSIYKSSGNNLQINYNAIRKASYISFGVVKPDNMTTEVNNGVLSIKNYSSIQQSIISLGSTINDLDSRLVSIENMLSYLTPSVTGPMVFTLVCDGLSSIDLTKPEYGETQEEMEVQKINATFIVNTNCPFKIAVNYIDNVSPAITLYEINYNDVDKYPGQTGLTRTFQSTNEEDVKISFSWLCKNYRDTDKSNYSTKTRIVIDIMYANDVSIKKETKYSIVRFNSLYDIDLTNNGETEEILIDNGEGVIVPIMAYRIQLDVDDNDNYNNQNHYILPEQITGSDYLHQKYKMYYENVETLPSINETITKIAIVENKSYEYITPVPKINLYMSLDGSEYTYSQTLSAEELTYSCYQYVDGNRYSVDNISLMTSSSDNRVMLSYSFVED